MEGHPLSGYFTDRRESRDRFAFTSNWFTGFTETRYSDYTRHELVNSFRSGLGALGKESISSHDLLADATDGVKGRFDKFDTGHTFFSRKELSIKHSFPEVFLRSGTNPSRIFRGPLSVLLDAPGHPASSWPLIPEINTGYYGPLFISRSNPTTPIAGLGQFAGEMNRLPKFFMNPDYLARKINYFRLLGNDYLNVTFGWLPFVNDLRKAVQVALRANTLASQIYRDSGKWVRRKLKDEPRTSVTTTREEFFFPYRLDYLDGSGADVFFNGSGRYGSLKIQEELVETYSFSAAFQYFIEGDGSFLSEAGNQLKVVDRLLGYKLTPAVLYELMPYSWLIDWMSNVGSVVSNWTQFMDDRLVMPYCYLMRESINTRRATAEGVDLYSFPNKVSPVSIQVTVQKERVRGTPFGFGLNPDGFSDRQWAILAALALTRGPRKLP
jgi:hypothetical protein